MSLWGYALQVSNLEGGICFEITQIWRISCADQPGFKVQCLLRFAFISGSVFHDFLVRTGLRSGVSELQLPCFTAVRAER